MRHYTVAVSNFKMTGESDSASTKRFLISLKDESIEFIDAISYVTNNVLSQKVEGFRNPITANGALVELTGDLDEFGDPWVSNERFEIRKLG